MKITERGSVERDHMINLDFISCLFVVMKERKCSQTMFEVSG